MPLKIFYAIVFCLVGCVSAAEKFWTYTPGEGIAFETVQGQVSLLTPTWQQVSEMEMIRKKQLTYHFFENEPQKFRCRIIFQRSSPIPAACLGFGIVLPLKTPALTYDGKRLVLPEHYKESKWILLGKQHVKKLEIPLSSGSIVTLSGNLTVSVLDGRKFRNDSFLVRLYFSPDSGELATSKLEFRAAVKTIDSSPLDLSLAVNMGLRDEIAGDGKGGWTDQGATNDLRQLSSGLLSMGGVKFQIIDERQTNKAAIVLGRKFLTEAVVPVNGKRGAFLYLLHASAWTMPGVLGKITVEYSDGTDEMFEIQQFRDVGNWWSPIKGENASVFWSGRNSISNVGLYLSQFKLRRSDPVRIRFSITASGSCWMIPAATLGSARIPLEMHDPETSFFPNSEWIPLDTPYEVRSGSPLDFSCMTDAPAGKYGFVIVSPEGNLSFSQAPAKRIRFVGVNLCFSANFPNKKDAPFLAERIRRIGYNAVRIHHQDDWLFPRGTQKLHQERLDRLEFFIAELKKRGLYVCSDLYTSRGFNAKDNLPEWLCSSPRFASVMKGFLPISDNAFEVWKSAAEAWLTHKNPYTGLALIEDPVLYSLSLVNEGNLDYYWNAAPELEALYIRKFKNWMMKKYPAEKSSANRKDRRFREFLHELQKVLVEKQLRFLKEDLKLKALCSDLNMQDDFPLALIRKDLDIVDSHKYHDHPQFPQKAWRYPKQYEQTSAVANMGNNIPCQLFASRLFGKPFCVTEYKYCYPNQYRSEGGPLIGAYAALQGWNALYHFAWSHSLKGMLEPFPAGTFDTVNEPLAQFSDRLTMFLFRRGDVKEADERCGVVIPADYWKSSLPVECPEEFRRLGLLTKVGIVSHNVPHDVYSLSHAQVMGLAPLESAPLNHAVRMMRTRKIAQSLTGELILDAGLRTFRIITPRTLSVTLHQGTVSAGALSVHGATVPQSISLISLDRTPTPISQSRSLLLLHLTDVLNAGSKFQNISRKLQLADGDAKLLLRRDPVQISIRLGTSVRPVVNALKIDGTFAGRIVSRFENGVLHFTADPGVFPGGIMAYHIRCQ